jgi:uncharacterized protein YlxP (DUF503 family)
MLIAAALLELALPGATSLKDKRRVVRAVKDRLRTRFNVAVSEIADHDDWSSICLGFVSVGTDPRHLRERMAKAIRMVESLGLAEVVGDDVVVARLDEMDEIDAEAGEGEADAPVPDAWREE